MGTPGDPSESDGGPQIELGPDGGFTPASLVAIEESARAGHPLSMANHGLALYQSGQRAEGQRWMERAFQAGNVAAGFNLGSIWLAQGETNRAEEVWRQSAALGDPDAMVGLVRLALDRGDHDTVASWSARILDQPATFPITALGVALRQHGDHDGALRLFDQTIRRGDPFAMEYAARIHEQRGNRAEADRLRRLADAVRQVPGGEDRHR